MKPSELKELLDAATPGPWAAVSDLPNYAIWSEAAGRDVVQSPNRVTVNNPWREWTRERDANLIATSRSILPLLLQLWEAADRVAADRKLTLGMTQDECDLCDALAALDQYGEGEK